MAARCATPTGAPNSRAVNMATRCASAAISKTSAAQPCPASTSPMVSGEFLQPTPSPSPAAERGLAAPRPDWVRRARPLLGTLVEVGVADRRPACQLHAAIDAAFACIERVHALMSFHLPDSELRRLNRDAVRHPQSVDPHTYAVFETALRIAELSDGAFDPCVAPRLEEWGLLP